MFTLITRRGEKVRTMMRISKLLLKLNHSRTQSWTSRLISTQVSTGAVSSLPRWTFLDLIKKKFSCESERSSEKFIESASGLSVFNFVAVLSHFLQSTSSFDYARCRWWWNVNKKENSEHFFINKLSYSTRSHRNSSGTKAKLVDAKLTFTTSSHLVVLDFTEIELSRASFDFEFRIQHSQVLRRCKDSKWNENQFVCRNEQ